MSCLSSDSFKKASEDSNVFPVIIEYCEYPGITDTVYISDNNAPVNEPITPFSLKNRTAKKTYLFTFAS